MHVYNLLVRDSMEVNPDLDKIRKGNAADVKAIRNEFRNSNSFKINLAFVCVTKLVLSILFGIWILFLSYGSIFTNDKAQPTINDGLGYSDNNLSQYSFIDYIKCTIKGVSLKLPSCVERQANKKITLLMMLPLAMTTTIFFILG